MIMRHGRPEGPIIGQESDPPPIRVVHVTTSDMGLRLLLLNQLKTIREAGYDVVTVSGSGPDVPMVEALGIPHYPVAFTRRPFAPLQDLRAFWDLWRLFRRLRPTIVHTHNPKPTLYGQLAARLAGVPIVVNTLHGYYFHEDTPRWLRSVFILTERLAARAADVVLSQNREDIRTAIGERICPADKIKHLGNGIDVERFCKGSLAPENRLSMRRELGIPADALVIGFVGRLVREKGILELFEAATALLPEVPNLRLLLVGPIDHEKPDAIKPELAEHYGLQEICAFAGMRKDMPELYSAMDVCALPSHREGLPRVPMEACAMELPCVLTDIRGCREVVDPGVNGLLVPVRDSAALSRALSSLLADGELRQTMGRNGRALALDRFDERRVFSMVLEEYRIQLDRLGVNRAT